MILSIIIKPREDEQVTASRWWVNLCNHYRIWSEVVNEVERFGGRFLGVAMNEVLFENDQDSVLFLLKWG